MFVPQVRGVRIVSNGNITCWEDAVANLETTGADGVMSAEVPRPHWLRTAAARYPVSARAGAGCVDARIHR